MSEDQNKTGKCIQCGRIEKLTRGLCSADYQAFLRQKKVYETDDERNRFDELAVSEGEILPSIQGINPKKPRNRFSRLHQLMKESQDKVDARKNPKPPRKKSG